MPASECSQTPRPLVWEPGAQKSVDPGSGERAKKGDDHDCQAIAHESEQRSRTSSREGPAETKNGAANCVAHTPPQALRRDRDGLTR